MNKREIAAGTIAAVILFVWIYVIIHFIVKFW